MLAQVVTSLSLTASPSPRVETVSELVDQDNRKVELESEILAAQPIAARLADLATERIVETDTNTFPGRLWAKQLPHSRLQPFKAATFEPSGVGLIFFLGYACQEIEVRNAICHNLFWTAS